MSRPPKNPELPPFESTNNGSASGPNNDRPSRPVGAVVVALIVAGEAFALLGVAGWYSYQLLTGAPVASFWGAVFTLGLLLAFSGWLFAVGHFLFRGYRWPRAAALVAQLFVLTVGVPTITGGYPLAGLAMVVPAVLGIALLFDKRVIAFASKSGSTPPAL